MPTDKLFDLKNKVAVVLGGTSGIGLAIASAYAEAGADVVASSRRVELVRQTADELRKYGAKSLAIASDVRDAGSLVALRDAVMETFGRVDILAVSSGVMSKIPSTEVTEEEFLRIVDTNLVGTFRANQIFGRQMIAQNSGSIINIASSGSFRTILQMAPYTASKAGVVALTESLACEWAPFKVRVNAIAPGPFKTPLNAKVLETPGRAEHVTSHVPMRRFGTLPELAGAAIYLASDASSFVTGATLRVDGGLVAQGM